MEYNHKKIKTKKLGDYTTEIVRCCEYIFKEISRGKSAETVFTCAATSYGWAVAEAARRAIERNIS